MRTAIIGAGRKRNGIGAYIGKYLQQNGADVVSVLGTSPETAQKAAVALGTYGIKASAYAGFAAMMQAEHPDAVVIASPVRTHYEYVLKSLDHGVHIFCEKPFIWEDQNRGDIDALLEPVFEQARRKNRKIAMNCQWPFSLPFYEELCGPVDAEAAETFYIRLSPVVSGREMIPDSVPHALSLLYRVFGAGEIKGLSFTAGSKEAAELTIRFDYASASRSCQSSIELVQTLRQPRDFAYGFNGRIVQRALEGPGYRISFTHGDKKIPIQDPLELSVRDFISAAEKNREPAAGTEHIRNNMKLLTEIYNASEK
ncbi:MAG: Gfo/Idh/MocA family oxidoreductase [Desulfosalsimonadaceae bacterium]